MGWNEEKTDAKQQVDELTSAKSKLLIELGQEVYLAYRREEQIAPIVEEKGRAIQELDAKLYALLKEKGERKMKGRSVRAERRWQKMICSVQNAAGR